MPDAHQPAPRMPTGLGAAGKRAWRRLMHEAYEFTPSEILIVEEAARVADTLAELRKRPQDDPRTLREQRQQRELQRKLLTSIQWPADEGPGLSAWGREMAQRRWRKGGGVASG